MFRKATVLLLSGFLILILGTTASPPRVSAQTEFTLIGEWRVLSEPINNEVVSRLGNTLGFPERHIVFEQDGEFRTGFVSREDVGVDVEPLGVWRIDGNRFSATFQLWCQFSGTPCGSIVMRGEFTREDRIRGTMTAFFDVKDPTRPTGYDTWPMTFRGDRLQ